MTVTVFFFTCQNFEMDHFALRSGEMFSSVDLDAIITFQRFVFSFRYFESKRNEF